MKKSIIILALSMLSLSQAANADSITKYFSSGLVSMGTYTFIAYSSKDSPDPKPFKIRFMSASTDANIATGSLGFTFNTKEGCFYLNASEAAKLIDFKNQFGEFKKEADGMAEDMYVRIVPVSDDIQLVYRYNRDRKNTFVFVHTKMSAIDSPLAEQLPGVLSLEMEAFVKMAEALEKVKSKV